VAEQRRMIVTMRESAQTLLRIIDDVLDFSKIEAGRLELEAISFSLSGLVEAVLDTLRPQVLAKGLTLDNDDTHAAIACDMLNPAQCPEHALMARIPLGLGPSLHQLRSGSLHFVRRLHSYYGEVRLPTPVLPQTFKEVVDLARPEFTIKYGLSVEGET
jgi:signal transduction histidine kinase